MNILVVGAGAMGQLFGALLSRAGNSVSLLESDQRTIVALREDGVHAVFGDDEIVEQPEVRIPGDSGDPVDLVLLLTKAFDTEQALDGARNLMGDDTYVLTLQNGLGNADRIKRHVPRGRVLVGVTTYFSDRFGLNSVVSAGVGDMLFMPLTEVVSPRVEEFAQVFRDAGFHCVARSNVWTEIWKKVAVDAAMSSISAVCRVPCGGVGIMSKGMDLCGMIIDETAMVAHAYGIELDGAELKNALRRKIFGPEKDHVPSITEDVISCRRTEAGSISGGIVNKAHAKGLEAPYNESMFCLLRSIESTYDLQLS
ncbi:MAG: ketopantoate reductase family protein [Atopobiaceae bacterium]